MKYLIQFALIILFCLSSGIKVNSQGFDKASLQTSDAAGLNESKLVKEKNALSVNVGGATGGLGASYERMIQNRLSLEFGLGFWIVGAGAGAGVLVYPFKKTEVESFNFYFGLRHTRQMFTIMWAEFHSARTYLPIGFSYFTDSNIIIGFDLGPSNVNDRGTSSALFDIERGDHGRTLRQNKNSIAGNVKVGMLF